MTPEVRIATHQDRGRFGRVAPGVFDHPIRPDQLNAFLTHPHHAIAIALDNDAARALYRSLVYSETEGIVMYEAPRIDDPIHDPIHDPTDDPTGDPPVPGAPAR